MAIQFEQIPTNELQQAKCLQPHRVPEVLHIDDNALDAMYDFNYIRPLLINENATLRDCLDLFESTSRHLLLVTNDKKEVLGIIRAEDVQGTKPYQIMQERRIKREAIPINMLMIKGKDVLTFNIEDLKKMRLGNVVVTMQAHDKHYALVQEETEKQGVVIRGIYSISKMARALGADLSSGLSEVHSIMELQRKLDQ